MNRRRNLAILLVTVLCASTFVIFGTNRASSTTAAPDAYEPDNDHTQAHVIRMGDPPQQHSIYPSGDNDWLELRIDCYSNAVVCAYGTSVSVNMTLYCVNLTQITSNVTGHGGADGFCKISALLQPAIYYIQIAAADYVSMIPEYYVNATYATAFQTTLDTGRGNSVQLTPDGGYIIAGTTSVSLRNYVYLVKTDSSGNMQWNKTYGGNVDNAGQSVAVTSDGGYVITGSTFSNVDNGYDVYLVKTDSSGNMQWNKTYGGRSGGHGISQGYSVAVTPDGGYAIAGATDSFGRSPDDVYLVKTDSSGNMQWQKTYGGSGHDYGNSVALSPDGGYVIAGITNSYGSGGDDVYLVKTDSSGNMQWNKTYGGSNGDNGLSVAVALDGGYVIAGGTISYGSGGSDVYLVKTDSSGNMQWQNWYGGSCYDQGYSVAVTPDGGYVISGRTDSFSTTSSVDNVYLIKTDMRGNSPEGKDLILDEGTTMIPAVVYTILHDPPGDRSYSYVSTTNSSSVETTISGGGGCSVGFEGQAYFFGSGADVSSEVSTKVSDTSSNKLVTTYRFYDTSSQDWTRPLYIGPGYGDRFIGEAWLLHYRIASRTYPNGTTATVMEYGPTRETSKIFAGFGVSATYIRQNVPEPWKSQLLNMDIGRDDYIHPEDADKVQLLEPPYLYEGAGMKQEENATSVSSTDSFSFEAKISASVAFKYGFDILGLVGADGKVTVGLTFNYGTTTETAHEKTRQEGFVLQDHDGPDNITALIYYDKVFGTYMVLSGNDTRTSDPQEYTPIQHKVGVADVSCNKTVVCQGYGANVSVSIENAGVHDENVNVSVYGGSTPLASQMVPMSSQSCTDLVFNLNTTGLAKANYTLSACAWVPNQDDTLDNNYTYGALCIAMVGDITGGTPNPWDFVPDGKVDGKDIAIVAKCFGSAPGSVPPEIWSPNCDVNNDGKVDGKDIAIVAKHFGS